MISLDSQAEADFFLPLFVQNSALFDSNLHIGAVSKIARDPLDWYWIDSGDKVNFAIKWRAGEPSYGGNNEMCLTLTKLFGTYDFNDIQCYEVWLSNMMCQTVTLI